MAAPAFRWTWFPLETSIRLLVILLLAFLANRLLKMMTNWLVKPASAATRIAQMREQQKRTLAGVLYSGGTVLILGLALLTALPEFGFSVTPIAALGGLASVALGFAAQNLIRDVISGFLIVFEDQYVVGEKIRVGEALGCVEHFTLRRTVLRNEKGSLVTLANGEIRQVANLSRDWSQLYVDVQVAAEEPVDAALAALEKVASELRADPKWSAALVEGPQVLGVEALTLSGATLRVQVRTLPDRQDDVARELRRRIQLRFEREQIRLTGVQRVELVGTARSSEAEISGHLTQK